MFITPELQSQIKFLCREIWTEEWSGMLFYQTEGEFGDENFKVTAKGLFLLDIGSASYTEYDPADPEVIKFMVDNPEVLALKKGHIHSHHNMAVFFSGTDDDELKDNCGFHNFYLSLIVNNRDEMCAKIAFKAKSLIENHVTINFLNQEGKEKQKKLINKKEDECIYVYKCEIMKPSEVVEDSFKGRFQEVREAKELRNKAKRLSEAATKDKAFSGFNVDQRWRQAGLFDDVKGSTSSPKGGQIIKGKDESFWSGSVEPRGKGISVVDRVGTKTDPRVYVMLGKLLSLDFLYEGTLSAVIKKLDSEFFPEETDYSAFQGPFALQRYCDALETRATEFYIDAFPEDCNKLLFFDPIMQTCVEILDTYENDYPELINHLTEALNLEIKG